MRILLSAYACEPNKGSEPEVGWKWAITLCKKGNEVYVITRKNNKNNIENFLKKKHIKKLNFIYFDFPKWFLNIIKGKSNPNAYMHQLFWQIAIFFVIKSIIKKINFDLIHHVTYVNYRFPSFLCLLNIPFIFGPVAGGDTIPSQLKNNFSFGGKVREYLREVHIKLSKYSPLINLTLRNSSKIYTNSLETKKKILSKYHYKTRVILGIATDNTDKNNYKRKKNFKTFNICYAGNLIDIKGVNILIKTFIKIKKKNKNVILNIVGEGKQKKLIENISKKYHAQNQIKWHGQVRQKKLFKIFKKSNLLFFPALRDSGGMVILEAMSIGLPSAVLNIGGPGQIVDNKCGIKVNVKNKTEKVIIDEFQKKIVQLITNRKMYLKKCKYSYQKVKQFNWNNKFDKIYKNLRIN